MHIHSETLCDLSEGLYIVLESERFKYGVEERGVGGEYDNVVDI